MIIAVNTRFLFGNNLEGYGYFIKEVFRIMAAKHPDHRFYFIFDRPVIHHHDFPANVEIKVLSPAARHPLLWKLWYDIRIPGLLKQLRADVFVSPDGICSLATKVPQCLVIHDIGIVHFPADYRKSHYLYYKRYIPRFLKKAKLIATVSAFSKNDIIKHYGTDSGKIDIVYSAAKEIFHPLPAEVQEKTKEQWTGGESYFIYVGAIHPRKNLLNLLRAFSIFKKRQQSGMKLVLPGRMYWKNEEFKKLLHTYKYRHDVILCGYVDEATLVSLIASAYALVYPSTFEGFGVPVLEAMKCGVPALTSAGTSMQEIGEDAALYFDPHDHADIADKLMLIYKDEELRKELIVKGKAVAAKYSWERTADLLWNSIEKMTDDR